MDKLNFGTETLPDEIHTKLFDSISKTLTLTNPQFYNPYFECVNIDKKSVGTCLNSQYKVTQVDYIIDSDNESIDLESEPDESTTDDTHPADISNKLSTPEEAFAELSEGDKLIADEIKLQDKLTCKMRACNDDEKIINCFPLMAHIVNRDTGTTHQERIFCKRSPLLEPIKVVAEEQIILEPDSDISQYPEDTIKATAAKINSINNSSHVESMALYCLSKLTETGKCPSFPYYFGCINGISDVYYHNITDELPDLYAKKKFIDKTHNGDFEIVYVDMDDDLSSNASSINLDNILKGKLDFGSDISSEDEAEVKAVVDAVQEEMDSISKPATLDELPVADGDAFSLSGFSDVDPGAVTEDMTTLDDPDFNMDHIVNTKTMFNERVFFVKIKDMPVNYCFMERLEQTLDDVVKCELVDESDIISILFQVAFGLAVANKHYSFVHNDLHTDNVLFQKTQETYLYFKANGEYYRVPTHGRIAKIIDFARSTFKIGEHWIFSDMFKPDGEASGQYKFPGLDDNAVYWGEYFRGAEEPNPSFDLVRLAVMLQHDLGEYDTVMKFLRKISKSDDGSNMLDKEDDFELYIDIARNCHNAVPKKILKDKLFNRFIIKKSKIPDNKYVYCL